MPEIIIEEVKSVPEKPEEVPVTLVHIILNSGKSLDPAIRADYGDTLEETDSHIVMKSGKTGETIRIAQSQIAVYSTLTRMVPKDLPKPPSKEPK